MPQLFHIDDLSRQRAGKNKSYFEFLRIPAMSAGVYVLPKGGTDPQKFKVRFVFSGALT